MRLVALLLLFVGLAPLLGIANASYNITSITVHVYLNPNTSAHVNETIKVAISNQSVTQYQNNRIALNLTLSNWQQLVGSQLVEHIINPRGSIYNFIFLPGPAVPNGNAYVADMVMSYDVNNVTTVNQTSPRVFVYSLSPANFNFEHGASGEILSPNTTLVITTPLGSRIKSVSPIPDLPATGVTNNYANVTTIQWFHGEPLSKFSLVFVVNESIRDEVVAFFSSIYHKLGVYAYLIIAAVIACFILYAYFRASK